jgi:gamma-glutamyl-gamma-aminobutyraldehyde dehydrogenase
MTQAEIDRLRTAEIAPQKLLIGGGWQASQSEAMMEVISPIDGMVLTMIASGSKADTEAAVTAARRSFERGVWRNMPPMGRKAVLLKWAELIEADALALSVLGVRDNGTEIGMAQKAEAGSAVNTIRFYAEAIDKLYGEIAPTPDSHLGMILREPVGVVAAIVPWNFPLMIGAWKLAPALAMGNSLVLKPAETASLSLLRIAQLALEAGLPEGVLNVVTGAGDVVGDTLSASMDVDVLAFTGSGAVGGLIMQNAGRSNRKRCYLELGGKSPNVIFADAANMEAAADATIGGIFRNAGQVCVAGSRLLVEQSAKADFIGLLTDRLAGFRTGDPLQLDTQAGAINNARQLAQIANHVDTACVQGAALVTGGHALHEETGGYYYAPTILDQVGADDGIFQNEVFGPVLSVTGFSTEEEAATLANATDYGLAAAVFTRDLGRAHRMVRAIKAGVVHVNCYGGPDITVPLTGMKQSGNGSDKSLHALAKFTDLKTAWIAL